MKKLSLIVLTGVICCLIGCENAELVTCQEDNQTLQAEVDGLQVKLNQANDGVVKKNEEIEKIKADNIKAQTKAMQGIQTMMMKQGERDIQYKKQIKELKQQVESLKTELKEAKKAAREAKAEATTITTAETIAETTAETATETATDQ